MPSSPISSATGVPYAETNSGVIQYSSSGRFGAQVKVR